MWKNLSRNEANARRLPLTTAPLFSSAFRRRPFRPRNPSDHAACSGSKHWSCLRSLYPAPRFRSCNSWGPTMPNHWLERADGRPGRPVVSVLLTRWTLTENQKPDAHHCPVPKSSHHIRSRPCSCRNLQTRRVAFHMKRRVRALHRQVWRRPGM